MSDNVGATASPQPALALRATPASGRDASRFDQAQGFDERAVAVLQHVLADCERRSRTYGEAAIGLSGDVRHEAQILIAEYQNGGSL